MTKQERNNIILKHVQAELQDSPGIPERVGDAFVKWFQALVSMSTQQAQPQQQGGEESGAAEQSEQPA